MRKNKFVVLLLILAMCVFAVFGCAPTEPDVPETPTTENDGGGSSSDESASTYNADTLLATLRGELALNGKFSFESTGSGDEVVTEEADIKTFIAEDEYYCYGVSGEYVLQNLHYFKNEDGKLVKKTVDNHNIVKETVQTIGGIDEYDKMIKNPFSFVETSMMTKTGNDVSVNPKAAVGESTVGTLILSMFVNYVADVNEVTVTLNDSFEPVSIKVVTEEETEEDAITVYSFVASFVAKSSLDVPVYPYPASGDKTLLSQAFDKIKANNYTYTFYSSAVSGGSSPHSTGVVTETGVLVTDKVLNVTSGFIDEPTEGYLTEVEVENGKLKGTQNFWTDKTLADDKFPSMDFSVDVFEQVEDGYKLRDGSYNLETLLPDAMCNGTYAFIQDGTLIFKPSDDLSTVTYEYKSMNLVTRELMTITVVLTDFGTTQFPYDLTTDYEPYNPSASAWSEVEAQGNGVLGFLTLFPDGDIDEDIPFYATENGTFTYFGSFSGKFEIDITYASEDEVSWDLDYGYLDDFTGITAQGWQEITPADADDTVKGVYVKGDYKLTVVGESDFFGNGYVVYIYIEPYTAE